MLKSKTIIVFAMINSQHIIVERYQISMTASDGCLGHKLVATLVTNM